MYHLVYELRTASLQKTTDLISIIGCVSNYLYLLTIYRLCVNSWVMPEPQKSPVDQHMDEEQDLS